MYVIQLSTLPFIIIKYHSTACLIFYMIVAVIRKTKGRKREGKNKKKREGKEKERWSMMVDVIYALGANVRRNI